MGGDCSPPGASGPEAEAEVEREVSRGRLALEVLGEARVETRSRAEVDAARHVHDPVEAGVTVDVLDQAACRIRLGHQAEPPPGPPLEGEEAVGPRGRVPDAADGPAVL